MRIWLCLALSLVLTIASGCKGECTCELIDEELEGSESEKLAMLNTIAADKLIVARTGCKGGKSLDTCYQEALARLLSDDSPVVRRRALTTAGERGFGSLIETAEKWFGSDDADDATAAARYLLNVDPQGFDARVAEALASPHGGVQAVGARRVYKTKDAKHGPAIVSAFVKASTISDDNAALYLQRTLTRLPHQYMKEAIQKSDPVHLELLLEGLAGMKDPELVAAAFARASGKNLVGVVNVASKEALQPLVPQLLERLDDKRARLAIVERLGELGDPTAIPALLELLSTLTPGVKIKDSDGIETTSGIYEVYMALFRLGDEDAINKARAQLVAWSKRGPKEQREAAARSLKSFDKDLEYWKKARERQGRTGQQAEAP